MSRAAPDDPCGYQACRTTSDGMVLARSENGRSVVVPVDGAFAQVSSFDGGPVGEESVLTVARGLRQLDAEGLLDLQG